MLRTPAPLIGALDFAKVTMEYRYPKRLASARMAEIGVNAVATQINDTLGWLFRRTHQEHDFGIDGYIDVVTPAGDVTGQSIAVQIKCGPSYLKRTNHGGPIFQGEKKHLNFLFNLAVPVLLIICDPEDRTCYWATLSRDLVVMKEDSWAHAIPKSQKLNANAKVKLQRLIGDPHDYLSELDQDRLLAKLFGELGTLIYAIPREDIEAQSLKNIKAFFDRIMVSESLAKAVIGKLMVCVSGYEMDERELYEISEVRKWAVKARRKIRHWFLCSTGEKRRSSLQWLVMCTSNVVVNKDADPHRYLVTFTGAEMAEFLKECFIGLNQVTDRWGWSESYNRKISGWLEAELSFDDVSPDSVQGGNGL